MKIFEMSIELNTEEKTSELHCRFNEKDFDPEALDMIKKTHERCL